YVAGGNRDTIGVRDREGIESGYRIAGAIIYRHLGRSALIGAEDDVGLAVAVDVPGRHQDAARKRRLIEREEGHDRLERHAVEHLDLGRSPGPGAADDVRVAVAVDVADRHPDTAREGRSVEGQQRGPDVTCDPVVDVDDRLGAKARADHKDGA